MKNIIFTFLLLISLSSFGQWKSNLGNYKTIGKIWVTDSTKLTLQQKSIDTTNLKVVVINSFGTAFQMYWPTSGSLPLTTTGDIIYSSSGSTAARLGIGTAGQHLVVVGGLPAWRDTAAVSGGSGATSVGTPNATSTANGSDITSGVLTEHYADATNPGIGKLYTTAGTATDGSLTRTAINSIYAPLTSAALVTPTLGVAAATTINKVTITAPATNATLTLAQGSSLITAGAFPFTITMSGSSNATFPSGSGSVPYLSGQQTWTARQQFAGIAVGYVAKTSGYTSTLTDHTINYTTAGVTHTLLTAVGNTGLQYTIKNRAASGTVTIATTSSQTIDGNTAATYNLTTQNDWLTVESDGANWMVVGKRIAGETGTGANVLATSPTLVTPILGAATATSITTPKIIGSGTPTIAANTGAGSSPTIAIAGSDVAGRITLTTGTSPNTLATVLTVTYGTTYSSKPYVILQSVNGPSTDALCWVSDGSSGASSFSINSGGTALAASTTYVWYYHVIQ